MNVRGVWLVTGCLIVLLWLFVTDNISLLYPGESITGIRGADRTIRIGAFILASGLLGFLLQTLSTLRRSPSPAMPPITPEREAMSELERQVLAYLAETQSMLDHSNERLNEPYVMLTPCRESSSTERSGWLGGAPMLPDDVEWPQKDSVPYCFVGQLDLSVLPADLWSGLGPRNGWITVFVHPSIDRDLDVKVLHVSGNLQHRDRPVHRHAAWFERSFEEPDGCRAVSFRGVPVKMEVGRGYIPHAKWQSADPAAAMGHRPMGYTDIPNGAGTARVVLLELDSSTRLQWIWGDVYSIVFFISRDDLAKGNFGSVEANITN